MGRFKLKAKHSRRAGVALSDKHTKILQKRNYPPGQHGPEKGNRRRLTGYGIQLLEKQKARWMYGLRNAQFKKYFEQSLRKKGDTATNLFQSVEQRLDNIVFRVGFAKSRAHARQLVSHGHILVNGKRVKIASYKVELNDEITIKESSLSSPQFANVQKQMENAENLDWLGIDVVKKRGILTALPNKETTAHPYNLKIIVEFFSR